MRSETSLIQTIGRAARNAEGHVIMYADTVTDSMRMAIEETKRRRKIQMQYNEEHGITPQTIKKAVRDLIRISQKSRQRTIAVGEGTGIDESKKGIGEADRPDVTKEDEEGCRRSEFRDCCTAA